MQNKTWLPWILATLIAIGTGVFNYTLMRVDKTSDAQASMYEKYLTRSEYDKDYNLFCKRFDTVEQKLDRIYYKLTNAQGGPR